MDRKEYMKLYMRKWRKRLREQLISEFGSKCQVCGCQDKTILEFHHVNGYTGKYHPNGSRGGHENLRDVQRLLREGRKNEIILVCKYCHDNLG